MSDKTIRFIDSDYRELFTIQDGANIVITRSDGEKLTRACKFLDEYHTQIGRSVYHICEFAEKMERNGNTYEPESQLDRADITPAAVTDELGMFYRQREMPTAIGHLRGDFGRDGTRFFHTWDDYEKGNNTPEFKTDFDKVMFKLRRDILKDHASMAAYCHDHPDAKLQGEEYRYGFKMETEKYRYFIRCTTLRDDYFYVFCHTKEPVIDKKKQTQARQVKPKTKESSR